MVQKFKVKIQNDELGPYDVAHINELINSKKITNDSFLKYFPVGEWKKLSEYPEFKQEEVPADLTATTIMAPPEVELPNKETKEEKGTPVNRPEFKEFVYSKDKNDSGISNYSLVLSRICCGLISSKRAEIRSKISFRTILARVGLQI